MCEDLLIILLLPRIHPGESMFDRTPTEFSQHESHFCSCVEVGREKGTEESIEYGCGNITRKPIS